MSDEQNENAIPAEEANGAEVVASEEVVPAEPKDDAERTKLGRKVKYLTEEFSSVKSTLDEMKEMLSRANSTRAENFVYNDSRSDDDYITVRDAQQIWEQRESEKQKKENEYRTKYGTTLSQLAGQKGLDEAEYEEIEKELLDNHYGVNKTGDPRIDAQLQFNAAEAAVLRKKVSGKKTPLNGGSHVPLGVPAAETRGTVKKPGIQLDAELQNLMRQFGKDPSNPDHIAWAQKALERE